MIDEMSKCRLTLFFREKGSVMAVFPTGIAAKEILNLVQAPDARWVQFEDPEQYRREHNIWAPDVNYIKIETQP